MAGERSDLGKIFITDGGIYDANTTYEKLTMVSYNNSTYITLRTVTGVTPSNDRINYGLMAQGFTATYLSSVTAEDVQGLVVEAGSETPAQSLINAIADRVANQLVSNSDLQDILSDYILKSAIANNLSITEEGKVLDARQGKALNDAKADKTTVNEIDGRFITYIYNDTRSGIAAKEIIRIWLAMIHNEGLVDFTTKRTYPVFLELTGPSATTMVGYVGVSPTAMRFLLSAGAGSDVYHGVFMISSHQISYLYRISSSVVA